MLHHLIWHRHRRHPSRTAAWADGSKRGEPAASARSALLGWCVLFTVAGFGTVALGAGLSSIMLRSIGGWLLLPAMLCGMAAFMMPSSAATSLGTHLNGKGRRASTPKRVITIPVTVTFTTETPDVPRAQMPEAPVPDDEVENDIRDMAEGRS